MKNSTDEDKIKQHKAKVSKAKKTKKTAFEINDNRIINILYLNEQLIRGWQRCITFSSITREQKYGLGSVFKTHCNKNNKVKSSRSHKTGKRGIETLDVNSSLAILDA